MLVNCLKHRAPNSQFNYWSCSLPAGNHVNVSRVFGVTPSGETQTIAFEAIFYVSDDVTGREVGTTVGEACRALEPVILQWYRCYNTPTNRRFNNYEDIFGSWTHIAEEPPESEVACTGPSSSPEPEPPRILSALERVLGDTLDTDL